MLRGNNDRWDVVVTDESWSDGPVIPEVLLGVWCTRERCPSRPYGPQVDGGIVGAVNTGGVALKVMVSSALSLWLRHPVVEIYTRLFL